MKNIALPLLVASALMIQGCSNAGLTPIDDGSGSSSDGNSSSGSTSGGPPSTQGNAAAGEELFFNGGYACSGCHAESAEGLFTGVATIDVNEFTRTIASGYDNSESGVAAYIHDNMPAGQNDAPAACVDDCAGDIAAYLWSLRADSGSGSSSSGGSSSGGVVGSNSLSLSFEQSVSAPSDGIWETLVATSDVAAYNGFIASMTGSGFEASALSSLMGELNAVFSSLDLSAVLEQEVGDVTYGDVVVNRDERLAPLTLTFTIESSSVSGRFSINLADGFSSVGGSVVGTTNVGVNFDGLEIASGGSTIAISGNATLGELYIDQSTMEIEIVSVAGLDLTLDAASGGVNLTGSLIGSVASAEIYDTSISIGDPELFLTAAHNGSGGSSSSSSSSSNSSSSSSSSSGATSSSSTSSTGGSPSSSGSTGGSTSSSSRPSVR